MRFIFACSQDINWTWYYVEFLYWHKAIICKKNWGPYSEIFILTLINLKSQSNNQNTEVLSQKKFDKILWRWDKNDFFFPIIYLPSPKQKQNKSPVSKSVRMMNKLNAFTKWCSLLLSQVTSPCDFDPSLPLYPNPIDKQMHKVKGRIYSTSITKWIRL